MDGWRRWTVGTHTLHRHLAMEFHLFISMPPRNYVAMCHKFVLRTANLSKLIKIAIITVVASAVVNCQVNHFTLHGAFGINLRYLTQVWS